MSNKKGFTLIELLIVVAIIAILAAIALPNFLEAQIRAKTSRVKADFRSIATAMESYMVDWNSYPELANYGSGPSGGFILITTPIAYISQDFRSPFGASTFKGKFRVGIYELGSGKAGVRSSDEGKYPNNIYMLEDDGPDRWDNTSNEGPFDLLTGKFPWPTLTGTPAEMDAVSALLYDPTNGTVSGGEIIRMGGQPSGSPVINLLFQK